MKVNKSLLFYASLGFWLWVSTAYSAVAGNYELHGNATLTDPPSARTFDVYVKDNGWLIRTTPLPTNALDKTAVTWEACSPNGAEVYKVSNFPNAKYSVSIVESNRFPSDSADPLIPILWLMFASGNYYKTHPASVFRLFTNSLWGSC